MLRRPPGSKSGRCRNFGRKTSNPDRDEWWEGVFQNKGRMHNNKGGLWVVHIVLEGRLRLVAAVASAELAQLLGGGDENINETEAAGLISTLSGLNPHSSFFVYCITISKLHIFKIFLRNLLCFNKSFKKCTQHRQ